MFDPLIELSADPERLAAVWRTALLDTPAEEAFDRLTRMAALMLGTPVALCALLDVQRFYFKSVYGIPLAPGAPRERSTRETFCQHAVARRRPLVIEDTLSHPEYRDHPAVRDLGVRGYLGVPLMAASGHGLGIFCVFDTRPRAWTPEQIQLVSDLAAAATTEIEMRAVAREAEAARAEAQRLYAAAAESDRRKDEFLALLGHELRNPLSPVLTAVQLVRLQRGDEALLDRACNVIERQVRHLTRLVDDLLDVSRITRGKIALRREPLAIGQLVARAVESTAPVIQSHHHRLVVDAPAEPLLVDGDPVRLEQVFCNLLHNAAKYTPSGGLIELRVARAGDAVRVQVRDNGEGIPAALLSRVFDPFTQDERTRGRSQGGLGVGLTLVRGLVELHGGTVEARSEGIGRGSEFVVTLPLLPARPAEAPQLDAAPRSMSGGSRLRILVVDDNTDAAETLSLLLLHWGHDVRTAHNGEAALRLASAHRPDLVLLDLAMPGIDGFEVARRLQEHAQLERTHLVAVSGFGQEVDRVRSRQAGFHQHLVKPVDPTTLESLLDGLGG